MLVTIITAVFSLLIFIIIFNTIYDIVVNINEKSKRRKAKKAQVSQS